MPFRRAWAPNIIPHPTLLVALVPGTRLGAYEILMLIGSGGMGEVYRARDHKLDRDVAIKILPEAFGGDPDRLARFEREAKTLAALNHPNIAHIHGFEDATDVPALVMELVDGPTLADRIARGPLPLDEAFQIAKQIAEGLEAAHEQGIIHRDLKPANIKVRDDGTVKVLDFGLAKALEPTSAASADITVSPTITTPAMLTGIGMILGTAAYMSPEQARGKRADKRSDVWAFGCVLYEMLTSRSAFGRQTPSDTGAAILECDPDWSALPADTPSTIRRLLKRCLEKDKKQRLDSAAAARLDLADALAADRRHPEPATRRSGSLAVAAGGGAIVAAVIMWGLLRAPAVGPSARFQYTIIPPSTQLVAVPGFRRSIALSPDGRSVAYFSGSGTGFGPLVLRRLDQLEGRIVPGVLAAEMTFSPDDQWIAFIDEENTIKKLRVDGGAPVEIVRDQLLVGSLSWGDDDAIMFASLDPSTGLLRVPANGGEVEVLTRPDATQHEIDHIGPSVIPRGRGVLFAIVRDGGVSEIAVLDRRSHRYKSLLRGSQPHYVAIVDGSAQRREFLVFSLDNSVRAVPFDGDRLELAGDPIVLADQVYVTGNRRANFSISQSGTLVYMPSTAMPARSLVWVDRAGSVTPVQGAPLLAYEAPRLSPDGSMAAFIVGAPGRRVATWNLKTGNLTRITTGSGAENFPVWMPNSRDLVFVSTRNGAVMNVYRQAADGSGAADRLSTSGNQQIVLDVVRDGSQALVVEYSAKGPSLLLIPTVAGQGNSQAILANGETSRLSPDGRFVAYESMESGRREVYVRPFPNAAAARWQVSQQGGSSIAWSRDGKELFYLDPSDTMMAARTTVTGTSFSAEPPRKLFDASFARIDGPPGFDVATDGRFLMPKPETGPAGSTSSTLVVKTRVFDAFK
jgi:eukaryotic-like serine/threonine-protein kinase